MIICDASTNKQIPSNNNYNLSLPKLTPLLFPFLVIIVFLLSLYYQTDILRFHVPKPITSSSVPVTTPTPTGVIKPDINLLENLYFVKDNYIQKTSTSGEPELLFDLKKEELMVPKNIGMKLSPDKKYLAYIGTSGGLDSAVKIIDLTQRRKIHEDVYGSADVTDIAWSPDSRRLIIAVNLKNQNQNYSSTLYLLDLNQTNQPGKIIFKPENIKITRVVWLETNVIYYSRIAYGQNPNCGLVKLSLPENTRQLKTISLQNASFGVLPQVDFVVSPNQKSLILFTKPDFEAPFAPEFNPQIEQLSLPNLNILPTPINYVPENPRFTDRFLVGIGGIHGSPDSSVLVVDTTTGKQTSLLDMGPSGILHAAQIVHSGTKQLLLVWSEFDSQSSLRAYDFLKCLSGREQLQSCTILWEIPDATSFSY